MTLNEAVYSYSTPHVAVYYILYEHVVYVPYSSLIHPPALVVCLTSDAALCYPYTRRSVFRPSTARSVSVPDHQTRWLV